MPIGGQLGWGCALLLFIWLGEEVRRGGMQWLDDPVRRLVHAHATPALTILMTGFSILGRPEVLIGLTALIVFWLVRTGRPRTALLFSIVVAGAEVVDQFSKLLFHRARPVPFFGLAPANYSFPSGHALVSCTFCGMLAAIAAAQTESRARRWLYYAAAAALTGAIGLSRIYLGVHYPSDVLGGYAAAVVWVFSVARWRGLRPLPRQKPPAHNT